MSAKEDPVRKALSGFSLYTLCEMLRQGSSIAVLGKELERYEVGLVSVIIANEAGVGRYTFIEPTLSERRGSGWAGSLTTSS